MCIIAYGIKKDIGTQHFQNCLTNNPDGFFLAAFKRGSTQDKPEYFIRTLLKKEVVNLWNEIPKDYIVLLHARIKTHGSISEKNVHGWNGNGWYFCHNGVLSIKNKDDLTDSETFFRYLFLPAFGERAIQENNDDIDNMVSVVLGGSKFVFWKKGKMLFYGDFQRPDKSKFAYFSNSSYLKYTHQYTCSSYGDELYYSHKLGYSKYSKKYHYTKKYYSLNNVLIPEKRVQ